MKLLLLLILVSGLNISIAAPTGNENVFETYVKTKCPIVKDNVEFFQQPIFNKCSSANVTISSNIEYLKSELNQENKNDLLCALFLNKFLTLCDKFQQAPAPDQINLKPDLSDDIFSTCKNLVKVSSIFSKQIVCLKFCSDDQGNILPQCALANYYASYETKSAVSVDTGNVDKSNKDKNIQSPVAFSGQVPEHIVETDQSMDDPTNNRKNTDYVNNLKFKGPAINNVSSIVAQVSNVHNTNPSANEQEINRAGNELKDHNPEPQSELNEPEEGSKKTNVQSDATLDTAPTGTKDQKSETKDQKLATLPVGTKDQTDGVPTGTKDQSPDTAPTGTKDQSPDTAPTGTKNQPSQTVSTGTKDQTVDTMPTGSKDRTSVKVEQFVPVKKVTLATDANSNPELLPQDENQPTNQEEGDLDEDKKDFAEQDENNQQLGFDENTNTDGDQDKPQQDNIKEKPKQEKPDKIDEDESVSNNNIEDIDGESYFFSYFMVVCVLFVLGYIFYHNRTKVMALVLEGKRSKRQYRGRRPNSANYHKLDSNLEEAISSSCSKNSSNIIY